MSDLISRAERFARVRHEGQFRKGKAKEPYTNHLVEVAALVERWSGSESAIAAAWLHDTVEDCPPTSVDELESLFGKDVAERRLKYIAWANTVIGQLPYLPKDGLSEFLKRCDQAELNAYDDLGTIRKAQNAAISILERKAKRAGADEAQIRKFMLSFMQGAF